MKRLREWSPLTESSPNWWWNQQLLIVFTIATASVVVFSVTRVLSTRLRGPSIHLRTAAACSSGLVITFWVIGLRVLCRVGAVSISLIWLRGPQRVGWAVWRSLGIGDRRTARGFRRRPGYRLRTLPV